MSWWPSTAPRAAQQSSQTVRGVGGAVWAVAAVVVLCGTGTGSVGQRWRWRWPPALGCICICRHWPAGRPAVPAPLLPLCRPAGEVELRHEDVIPNSQSLVVYSRRGYIKRMRADTFGVQKLRGKGEWGGNVGGRALMAFTLAFWWDPKTSQHRQTLPTRSPHSQLLPLTTPASPTKNSTPFLLCRQGGRPPEGGRQPGRGCVCQRPRPPAVLYH